MKLHLTNYDPSEYLIFQDFLNNLSKKGYNCKNVDIFTFLKKIINNTITKLIFLYQVIKTLVYAV